MHHRSVVLPSQRVPVASNLVVPQGLYGALGVISSDQDVGIGAADELLANRLLDPGQQAVVETIDIEDADTLVVDPQLVPSHRLHQLLHGAVAATEGDESAPRTALDDLFGHLLLPRVHVLDYGRLSVHCNATTNINKGQQLVIYHK